MKEKNKKTYKTVGAVREREREREVLSKRAFICSTKNAKNPLTKNIFCNITNTV